MPFTMPWKAQQQCVMRNVPIKVHQLRLMLSAYRSKGGLKTSNQVSRAIPLSPTVFRV